MFVIIPDILWKITNSASNAAIIAFAIYLWRQQVKTIYMIFRLIVFSC